MAKTVLEQISFEARENEYVDAKSGVSARMSITAYQNLMSTAERRLLKSGDEKTTIRLADFLGIIPAITGKVELVYEGELEGADFVAENLIENAVKTTFTTLFPKIEKLEKKTRATPYDEIIQWFASNELELANDATDESYRQEIDRISPLKKLIEEYQPDFSEDDHYFLSEIVLWALVSHKKISKQKFEKGMSFENAFSSYLKGL